MANTQFSASRSVQEESLEVLMSLGWSSYIYTQVKFPIIVNAMQVLMVFDQSRASVVTIGCGWISWIHGVQWPTPPQPKQIGRRGPRLRWCSTMQVGAGTHSDLWWELGRESMSPSLTPAELPFLTRGHNPITGSLITTANMIVLFSFIHYR